MKNKILILLALFCVIGQIEEIKTQNIQMGDYIRQNAVIQYNPPNGAIYFKPCLDCTAQITVYNDKNKIIIFNRPMTDLQNAQFGYLTSFDEFTVNILYRVVVNFTSTSLGSGIASSTVYINQLTTVQENPPVINEEPISSAPAITKYKFSDIQKLVNDLIEFAKPVWDYDNILSVTNLIALARSPIYLVILILNEIYILKIITGVIYIILVLFDVSLIFLGYLVDILSSILIFLNNPVDFIENVYIPWLIDIWIAIALIYLGIVLLIETIFIGISVFMASQNIFTVLEKWAELHFLTVKYIMIFSYGFIILALKVLETLIKIVLMIVPTKGS